MNKPLQKQMYIVTSSCWKCDATMNVALITGDAQVNNGQVYGPESFSKDEIKIAEDHNVLIKAHHSATRQETYCANTCANCGTFVGQHFLFTDYFYAAQDGDCEYKKIDLA